MLSEIHEHARRGETFAFETTLSGRGYARSIPVWQEQGYQVSLFFLQFTDTGVCHASRQTTGA